MFLQEKNQWDISTMTSLLAQKQCLILGPKAKGISNQGLKVLQQ